MGSDNVKKIFSLGGNKPEEKVIPIAGLPMDGRIPARESLEDVLAELCKFGNPRVSNTGENEWYSSMKMFVTGEGVEFEIKSDFKSTSPLAAAQQCRDRMHSALKSLGLKF